MGLFDFLSNMAKDIVTKTVEEASQRSSSGSALSPGRMRETDKIKGSDSPLPRSPGMYRHINKETHNIDYVGQTDNLRKRQQEHARSGMLDIDKQYVQYGEAKAGVSKDVLCKTEEDHIARHKPSKNTTKGGNGRR